jgi:hypothetical protein
LERSIAYVPDITEGTATSNKPIAEKMFAGVKVCAPEGSVPVRSPALTTCLNEGSGGSWAISRPFAVFSWAWPLFAVVSGIEPCTM